MSSFCNGQLHSLDFVFPYEASIPIIKREMFPIYSKPIVKVEMSPLNRDGKQRIVSGLMDTGAGKTFLDFDTASILGIDNPKKDHEGNFIDPAVTHSITNEDIEYYTHKVLVSIKINQEWSFRFSLRVRFAEKIKQNIFGRDWLMTFCLAFDSQKVHLLHNLTDM